MLKEHEVDRIHEVTVKVLSEVGVKFKDKTTLQTLERAGCSVNEEYMVARFPRSLIQKAVSKAPSEFKIKARNKDNFVKVGGSKPVFQNCPGLNIRDIKSGKVREARREDAREYIRLLDSLDHIDIVVPPTGSLADTPPEILYERLTANAIRNTSKVIAGGNFAESAEWIVEMAEVTGQEVYGQFNPISPLCFSQKQIEGVKEFISSGHPVSVTCSPMLGANSPVTLAGSLVLQNAEHLAALIMLQTIVPETRVTLATYPHVMDMRDAYAQIGGIEIGIFGAAFSQLASKYDIPSHTQFPWSDSKKADVQAGYEKGMQIVMCAEGGADIITNGGGLDSEKIWSPLQLVIDNEMNGMALRLLEGVEVNEDTLAFDVIESVGHLSGSYFDQNHTFNHWEEEQFLTELADRKTRKNTNTDLKENSKTLARNKAESLMGSYNGEPLTRNQDSQLEKILSRAKKEKLS